MTGRERLEALLHGRLTDRLCWSTAVDSNTLDILPGQLKAVSCFDFYRHVGCDVVQLGGWGTPWQLTGCRLVMPGVDVRHATDAGGSRIVESQCRRGVLTARTSPRGHPVEYPVKSLDDVRLLRARWEDASYEAVDESEAYAAIDSLVGDDGITTLFAGPSVIPHLLEVTIGMEQFYYLMADHPDEMDALIRVMQEKEELRFELCSRGPCDVLILVENTSTRYISPQVYERYNMPSQRRFVDEAHRKGKTAILHMCGHVRDLLPVIRETKADGIHALTPPPTGDTPWETALGVLGDDLIIMSVLPTDVMHMCPADEIGPALDRLVTPRLRRSRFMLNAAADGIPTPLERFLAIRDWVEQC